MQIPDFLSHLRTDRRGIPVPVINLWGTEQPARMSIEHDPNVGRPGLFLHDEHEQTPDFTRQNMGRQRQSMMQGRCQVCWRLVPWSRRFLIVAAMSTEEVDYQGRKVRLITEPWLDEACGRFAIEKCPALIRRASVDGLKILPVTNKTQIKAVVSSGWVDGPLEAESRRLQPAMWVKLLLVGVRIEVSA